MMLIRSPCLTIFSIACALLLPVLGLAQLRHNDLSTGKIAQGAIDRRSLAKPAINSIYSCDRQSMGEALDRPWVDETGVIDFSKKPAVEGSSSWDSRLKLNRQPVNTDIEGNGLPQHATGQFPVERASTAFRYDRNPNTIQAHFLQYRLPTEPKIAPAPGCLPMGTIGVALSGAVFFNALDAPGRDAVVNEIFDKCEGHPERNGRYHYHHFSPCFDQGDPKMHSPLIGYALDGFGIYGPRDDGGSYISNDQLDECHGHVGPVPASSGTVQSVYHYHANREFPYTLGCFRGGAVVQPRRNPGARPRAANEDLGAPALRIAAAGPQRSLGSTSAHELSLITMGTGGPPASSERAGPSALVRYGNARLLVDMGRDTQNRLQQSGVALRDLSALLFTHHHLDHNEEFAPILLKARLQGGAGVIVGPPGTQRYADFVLDFYKEDSDYRAQRTGGSGEAMRRVNVREVNGGETFALAGLTVKTARVNHTIHTVAYRFDGQGKSVVISGDLSFSPSLIDLARDADLLLIDAGQLAAANDRVRGPVQPKPGTGDVGAAPSSRPHSTLTEIAEMARQANIKKLVLTHFANPKLDEALSRQRLAEIFKGEIIFARDLLEISP